MTIRVSMATVRSSHSFRGRKLAGPLGHIEDDGGCGSIKLIAEMPAAPRYLLEDAIGCLEKGQRGLVYVEFS